MYKFRGHAQKVEKTQAIRIILYCMVLAKSVHGLMGLPETVVVEGINPMPFSQFTDVL
jgi:hypothetical protein